MMRLGQFYVADNFVLSYRSEIKRVMGRCTILSASYNHHESRFTYVALCDLFRLVASLSAPLPLYQWCFDNDGDMWVKETGIQAAPNYPTPEQRRNALWQPPMP